MARVSEDATAFAHRQAPILAVAVNFWQDQNDFPVREEWLHTTVAALDQGVPGAYVGFIREETGARLNAAYPADVGAPARRQDNMGPDNVFRRNLNIPSRTNSAG